MVDGASTRRTQKPRKAETEEEISWGNKGLEGFSYIPGEAGMKRICIGLGVCSEKI